MKRFICGFMRDHNRYCESLFAYGYVLITLPLIQNWPNYIILKQAPFSGYAELTWEHYIGIIFKPYVGLALTAIVFLLNL